MVNWRSGYPKFEIQKCGEINKMGKGFGKRENNIEKLKNNIRRSIRAKIKRSEETSTVSFVITEKKNQRIGQKVTWELAQEYPELGFVFVKEDSYDFNNKYPLVLISSEVPLNTLVSQSKISENWKVVVQPPGAIYPRTIVAYKDKEKAESVAKSILLKVRKFDYSKWDIWAEKNQPLTGEFILDDIPENEDFVYTRKPKGEIIREEE